MESSQSTRLEEVAATGLYLDLMKRVLTRYQFPEPYLRLRRPSWPPYKAALPLLRKLRELSASMRKRVRGCRCGTWSAQNLHQFSLPPVTTVGSSGSPLTAFLT